MQMKFWKRKTKEPASPSLILSKKNGVPVYNFPIEVVDNLRYTVTRIERNSSLPPRLAIVSALREEGVTYLTQALAATVAHDMPVSVCVVDLNWWWPSATMLAGQDNPGLAGVFNGEATLEEIIVPTSLPNLALVPAGQLPAERRPVIARSQVLVQIMEQLSKEFDHLILDVPAVRATTDAVPLASLGDACCLVIRQGVTTAEDVRLALDEIDHLSILGVILNQVRLKTPRAILKFIPTD
jgi:Mrp family chromosome partitioning ATPase